MFATLSSLTNIIAAPWTDTAASENQNENRKIEVASMDDACFVSAPPAAETTFLQNKPADENKAHHTKEETCGTLKASEGRPHVNDVSLNDDMTLEELERLVNRNAEQSLKVPHSYSPTLHHDRDQGASEQVNSPSMEAVESSSRSIDKSPNEKGNSAVRSSDDDARAREAEPNDEPRKETGARRKSGRTRKLPARLADKNVELDEREFVPSKLSNGGKQRKRPTRNHESTDDSLLHKSKKRCVATGDKRTSVPWTKEEDAILCQKHSLGLSWGDVAKLLPRRSAEGVQKRGNRLGLFLSKPLVQSLPVQTASSNPERERQKRLRPLPLIAKAVPTVASGTSSLATVAEHSRNESLASKEAGTMKQQKALTEKRSREVMVLPKDVASDKTETLAGAQLGNWSENEDSLLLEKLAIRPPLSKEEIAKFFPGRTAGAVCGRASRLGLFAARQSSFKKQEPTKRALSKRVGKSLSVESQFEARKATPLAFKEATTKQRTAPPAKRPRKVMALANDVASGKSRTLKSVPLAKWTEYEDNLLREKFANRPALPWQEIASFFPGRTLGSVSGRASTLGLTRRSSLKKQEPTKRALSKRAGKPLSHSEARKAPPSKEASTKQQGVLPAKQPREVVTVFGSECDAWTKDEDDSLLEKRRCGMTFPQIAKSFHGRSAGACKHRYRKLVSQHRGHLSSLSDNPSSNRASSKKSRSKPRRQAPITSRSTVPRFTAEDIALVKASYLTSFPKW